VQAPRFQFMAGASIAEKPVKLTYIHAQKRNATVLEANLAFDPRNKVVGKYSFNTNRGSLKYTYVHTSGATFEPSYDFHTEAWHWAASRKVGSHDNARFCYDAHHSTLGVEWTRDSKEYGQFKVPSLPNSSSVSWIETHHNISFVKILFGYHWQFETMEMETVVIWHIIFIS
jgi:hypothetical protein